MKLKLLFKITACAITALIVTITLNVNFNSNSSDFSDIALTNVEALANNESGDCSCYGPKMCSGGAIWCNCTNSYCCEADGCLF